MGGLVALIVILSLILFCLHRRKKAKKASANEAPTAPPAELDVTQVSHELSTSNASKYVAIHDRPDPYQQHGYAEHAPFHQATGYDHAPSHPDAAQSYHSASPQTSRQHGSLQDQVYRHPSQSSVRSPHGSDSLSADEHAARNDQHGAWSHQASPTQQMPARQRQHSYPTPTSPQRSLDASAQQQSQVYYPPPQDSLRHPQPSHNLPPNDSPANTQYSGEAQHGYTPNMSTTTTPAHFYAQPTPARAPTDNAEHR